MKIRLLKVGARAGQITADNGMLNRMVAAYDPRRHEAPLFIGAGGETAPAVGWVSSLSRDGGALCAEIIQVPGQVQKELKEGRRQVNKVGFYTDYGLRNISLTGEPLSLPGIPSMFKDHEQYYEFQQGGDDMNLDDPRMKAFLRIGDEIYCGLKPKQFSESDNPGEILHRKAMDIMMNPSSFDKRGKKLNGDINYSDAFALACEQNPGIAAQYILHFEEGTTSESDPEKELHQKALAVVENPPAQDHLGRPWAAGTYIAYKQAVDYVLATSPALANRFENQRRKKYIDKVKISLK